MVHLNRKLLVSVFNAQEAREAVLGGARIVDSEDPKSALGNIKPRQIMAISDAVLDFRRDLDVQLSTNIGEDQLLFRRSETGQAIEKSPYEIAGKAAQAAIGVACSMGTRVHPVNLVKVGVDGMEVRLLTEVLREVVETLHRTEQFCHTQVMSVLFAQNLDYWDSRKHDDGVRRVLVGLREFSPCRPEDEGAFDLTQYTVGTLRDRDGEALFSDASQVSLGTLIRRGVLPEGSESTHVRTTELFPHSRYFRGVVPAGIRRTTREVIKAMVDATADAGADAIMIDTSILSKTSCICCVDTASNGVVDVNRLDVQAGLANQGILSLEDIRFFAEYCHYKGIAANLAGSITSYQAQQLWVLLPELDQMSTRGAASAVVRDPSNPDVASENTRQRRVIKRQLVRGLAPPEHGGVLNVPRALQQNREAQAIVRALMEMISGRRKELELPELESYWIDPEGNAEPITQ